MQNYETARLDPYCGPAPAPGELYAAWNLDPVLIGALSLASLAGYAQLHRSHAGPLRRTGLSAAALLAFLAFVSPLCALTTALFAARGLHHLILIGLLAPALAVAIPAPKRAGAAGFLALSAALWAWHVPSVYAAAWDSAAVYWLMQAALLLPAWAFWSAVLSARRDLEAGMAASLQVAAIAGQMGLIGAILTFAPRPIYAEHLALTEVFGLSPLADQQLAGLVMWVPGMLPMALVAFWILRAAWLREARA